MSVFPTNFKKTESKSWDLFRDFSHEAFYCLTNLHIFWGSHLFVVSAVRTKSHPSGVGAASLLRSNSTRRFGSLNKRPKSPSEDHRLPNSEWPPRNAFITSVSFRGFSQNWRELHFSKTWRKILKKLKKLKDHDKNLGSKFS